MTNRLGLSVTAEFEIMQLWSQAHALTAANQSTATEYSGGLGLEMVDGGGFGYFIFHIFHFLAVFPRF